MRPSRARPQRQQRRALADPVHFAKVRQGLLPVLVVDLHHFAVARTRPLGERQVDGAFLLRRDADDDGPVELFRFALAERLGQPLGRLPRPGDQQQATRVLVEPMDQPGPVLEAEPKRIEHAVDMPLGARAALRLRWRRRRDAGRQADLLPRLDPVLSLDPPPIDTDLPRAQQFLQGSVGQSGEMTLEPAIQPQAGLVVGDGAVLDLAARAIGGGAFAHGAQPRRQAKQGPWNRCLSIH